MKPAVTKRLRDALVAASLIQEWVRGIAYDDYASDRQLQSALERQLMVVGEALNHARRGEPGIVSRFPKIHEWVAQRNFLIHVDAEVSEDIVRETIVREVPELIGTLEGLLLADGEDA